MLAGLLPQQEGGTAGGPVVHSHRNLRTPVAQCADECASPQRLHSEIPHACSHHAVRVALIPEDLKCLVSYLVSAFGQRRLDDSAWKRVHGGWGGDSSSRFRV